MTAPKQAGQQAKQQTKQQTAVNPLLQANEITTTLFNDLVCAQTKFLTDSFNQAIEQSQQLLKTPDIDVAMQRQHQNLSKQQQQFSELASNIASNVQKAQTSYQGIFCRNSDLAPTQATAKQESGLATAIKKTPATTNAKASEKNQATAKNKATTKTATKRAVKATIKKSPATVTKVQPEPAVKKVTAKPAVAKPLIAKVASAKVTDNVIDQAASTTTSTTTSKVASKATTASKATPAKS